jgi:cytochrome P450
MPTVQTDKLRPGEKVVVTEGGVRRDGQVFDDAQAAQPEVERRRKALQEQAGDKTPPAVEVKRQLFG